MASVPLKLVSVTPSVPEEVGRPVPLAVGCGTAAWALVVALVGGAEGVLGCGATVWEPPVGVAEAVLGCGATVWEPPVGVVEAVGGCAVDGLLQKKSAELLRSVAMASTNEKVIVGVVVPSLV